MRPPRFLHVPGLRGEPCRTYVAPTFVGGTL